MKTCSSLYLLLFANTFLFAQINLIQNPGFLNNTNNWEITGNASLSHVTNGALTSGAARLNVNQSGNIGNASMRTEWLDISQNDRGKMHYLSLHARTDNSGEKEFRIQVEYMDGSGNEEDENFDEYILENNFRDYSMPVFISENIVSVRIRFQCGAQSGTYFFDDIDFSLSQIDAKDIAQLGQWESRQFVRPENMEMQTLGEGSADVTISINTENTTADILPEQFGVNSNFRSGDDLVGRSGLYEGFGSFRFPAGSGSNLYFWDGEVPDETAIEINELNGQNNQFLKPENFITFKNNADGEPTVVVNYMYARYGVTPEGTREARVQQAADYAASLVHFFNVENNAEIKYWEIGNECYGPWETGHDVDGSIISGKEYGEDFRVFVETMKAVDANIKCGAVLWHKGFEWNNQVLKEVGDHADFLIVHHYFSPNSAADAADALLELKKDMQEIQSAATYNTGKPPGHFPVAFTEFNIQEFPATTIFNGLFVAEVLPTMVESGFFMTNIWVNEWNISDNHSKGLLAQNDPNQANYTPRPTYTPFYFYDKYFGDHLVETALAGDDEVRAYSSIFSSGETGVMVVNYSNSTKKIKFDFTENNISADSIFWHTVHAENMNEGNTKFFVNGETGNTSGGGPELNEVSTRAAIFSENKIVEVPKFSATYIAFNSNVPTSTDEREGSIFERIYPNPTDGNLFIENINEGDGNNFEIFDINGQRVDDLVKMRRKNDRAFLLDCSALLNGIYFLKTENGVQKFCKK